ncbi:hypothetical protein DSL72_009332 [Monilinia vaccinii-corymbosi]|uniref:Heme oxygenase-like protein n=1 Tax=Monilinia vaccinii-corymbosi TaxID=61207 RepID=A0A8A3PP82_9HELO|nr:hypothetical protein DSL72_009332 [Monilinia vaccinii-corymbosi]
MAESNIINSNPPLQTPAPDQHSLSEQINIATRAVHAQLNRLILLRLPLALPPYTTNPSIYVSGLLHIAPIYIAFESLWQTIIDAPSLPISLEDEQIRSDCPGDRFDSLDSRSSKVCSRTQSLLSHLLLPGLLRAARLKADICTLTGTPDHKIEEQLRTVSENGRLAEFIAHTKQSVQTNSHVLLAYAWVLYMALFSGGRYLRASLKAAGGSEDFWDRESSPVRPYEATRAPNPTLPPSRAPFEEEVRPSARRQKRAECSHAMTKKGLQFFDFIGDEDGEDIKREFKRRIAEAEVLLTDGEKADIIKEAQAIFSFMIMMVSELDGICGSTEEDLETPKSSQPTKLHQNHKPLNMARGSIALTQERLSKMREEQGSDEDVEAMERKPSLYASFIEGPMAKLVRFKDGLPGGSSSSGSNSMSKSLPRKHSTTSPFTQSGNASEETNVTTLGIKPLVGLLLTVGGPLIALTAALTTWYYVG